MNDVQAINHVRWRLDLLNSGYKITWSLKICVQLTGLRTAPNVVISINQILAQNVVRLFRPATNASTVVRRSASGKERHPPR
jgi:hypothetical protein